MVAELAPNLAVNLAEVVHTIIALIALDRQMSVFHSYLHVNYSCIVHTTTGAILYEILVVIAPYFATSFA